jgi:hypothetical protein
MAAMIWGQKWLFFLLKLVQRWYCNINQFEKALKIFTQTDFISQWSWYKELGETFSSQNIVTWLNTWEYRIMKRKMVNNSTNFNKKNNHFWPQIIAAIWQIFIIDHLSFHNSIFSSIKPCNYILRTKCFPHFLVSWSLWYKICLCKYF